MTNSPPTSTPRGAPTPPGGPVPPPSGKAALALAGLLALGCAAILWWLAGGESRRPSRQGAGASPAPNAHEPARTPLVDATRLDVRPDPTDPAPAPPEPCRLVVRILPPQEDEESDDPGPKFTGTALVQVRAAQGSFTRTAELTAASPSVELECAPGEYEFTLERYGPEPLGALPVRTVLEPGADETVTLLLARLHALTGSVRDANGQGYAGVRIALQRRGRTAVETETGQGGSFALEPLPVGEYEFVVGDPAGPLLTRRSVNLADWHGEMSVVVPVLLELEVRVVDGNGRAVAGARVEGLGQRGGRVMGATGRDGSLRAPLLPPGSYRVTATHPKLGRGESRVELSPDSGAALEIRLLTDAAEDAAER